MIAAACRAIISIATAIAACSMQLLLRNEVELMSRVWSGVREDSSIQCLNHLMRAEYVNISNEVDQSLVAVTSRKERKLQEKYVRTRFES